MLTLGLLNMRDAAAALVEDGRLIAAAEEERFLRIKHVTAFPHRAVHYCLAEAGLSIADIDAIAVPWKYWVLGRRAKLALGAMLRSPALFQAKSSRSLDRLRQEWLELFRLQSVLEASAGPTRCAPVFLDHHLCHAASTFLVSPFDRAAILVVDGASEADSAMLAVGEGTNIRVLSRVALPHSLGQFYAAMTSFLGFRPDHDEYIVMGLAAYGAPRFADTLRRQVLSFQPEGQFRVNTCLLDFHLARLRRFVPEFQQLLGPPRQPDSEITQYHRDLAASVQVVLEDTLLHMAKYLKQLTGAGALCLAGGVAQNCVANSRVCHEAGFAQVFIQPAPGDAGTGMGAALWWSARQGRMKERTVLSHAYWGPRFSVEECRQALAGAGLAWEELDESSLCERIASELAQGRLVFWFQGRMEWGARALGNRSLLADPRRADVRELINARVKLREPFRPFAPSVLEERAGEFFDQAEPSPFMLRTFPVRAAAQGLLPAITHVDGTARVQTVDKDSNPRFRRLLEAFNRLTSLPVLLNTSFNVNEPIVCTPDEAIRCFLGTRVEWLVLESLVIRNPACSANG